MVVVTEQPNWKNDYDRFDDHQEKPIERKKRNLSVQQYLYLNLGKYMECMLFYRNLP